MPYQDLRAFLTALKDAGELVEIARPVSPKYDIAKALAKTSAIQGPALLFTQTGTDFPLVAGVYGTSTCVERHRHRYEVSNHYRGRLAEAGLVFSGTSPFACVLHGTAGLFGSPSNGPL